MAELEVRQLDGGVADALVVPEMATAENVMAIERPLRWVAPRLLVTEVASALLASADRKLLALARQRGVDVIDVPSA